MSRPKKNNAALLIVGHGSTLNPDSSNPTHQHAEAIRAQGIFAEVACAFWKEEPTMTEVFEMIESREIYIVPNFISEGYFCQQVLPRELRLTGPTTERDGKVIHYCDPVGTHPNMTRLLLQRADEVAPGVPRSETSLVIVGHGTGLNENSAKAIQDQVKLIRQLGNEGGASPFAEVIDAYMEEAPFVADWHNLTTAPNVVVVPFFISDGLHSYQDIPVLLGIEAETGAAASEREVFRHNPHVLLGKNLFYSSAIGTEPHLAEVILDQVEEFDRKHGIAALSEPNASEGEINDALCRWLEAGKQVIGEVSIAKQADRSFTLTHVADAAVGLKSAGAGSPMAGRELAKYDEEGKFRALKSAPTLKRGWRLDLSSVDELRAALDHLYPAALGMALAEEKRTLRATPLRELLGRQTGMYRFTNTISDEQAMAMITRQCDTKTKCLRRIVWGLTREQPLTGAAAAKNAVDCGPISLPLLCMEACCHIVSAARKIAQENHAAGEAAQSAEAKAAS